MIKIDVRSASEKDLSFVYATWLHNYQHNSYHAKKIRSSIFYKNHQKVLHSIVNNETTKIYIASPQGESEVILGYMVTGPQCVHFLYVKKTFRGFGVAKTLAQASRLDLDECSFSHWCIDTNWIVEKHPKLTYNPYLAYFKET